MRLYQWRGFKNMTKSKCRVPSCNHIVDESQFVETENGFEAWCPEHIWMGKLDEVKKE